MNNKNNKIIMFGVNCAGIKSKLESLNDVLKRLNPQIWTLQETKLKSNGNISCEAAKNYQIFYLNRKDSGGGGLAIGVDREIESTLLREGNDDIEALVIQEEQTCDRSQSDVCQL